jgi:hypothetical protein
MDLLQTFVRWEIQGFLAILLAIVFFQILNGRINTKGMLCSNSANMGKNGPIDPARLQLLVSTVGMALYYLTLVTSNLNPKTGSLPDVPESWPAILGGSHAIYLGGKAYSRWFNGKK